MQRSANARLTIRNFETVIDHQEVWMRTQTTAKFPTTDATETSQAAILSQVAPKISSQGLIIIHSIIIVVVLAFVIIILLFSLESIWLRSTENFTFRLSAEVAAKCVEEKLPVRWGLERIQMEVASVRELLLHATATTHPRRDAQINELLAVVHH